MISNLRNQKFVMTILMFEPLGVEIDLRSLCNPIFPHLRQKQTISKLMAPSWRRRCQEKWATPGWKTAWCRANWRLAGLSWVGQIRGSLPNWL